jgi:hypothetical protein
MQTIKKEEESIQGQSKQKAQNTIVEIDEIQQ